MAWRIPQSTQAPYDRHRRRRWKDSRSIAAWRMACRMVLPNWPAADRRSARGDRDDEMRDTGEDIDAAPRRGVVAVEKEGVMPFFWSSPKCLALSRVVPPMNSTLDHQRLWRRPCRNNRSQRSSHVISPFLAAFAIRSGRSRHLSHARPPCRQGPRTRQPPSVAESAQTRHAAHNGRGIGRKRATGSIRPGSPELPAAISTLRMKRSRPMRLTGEPLKTRAKGGVVKRQQKGERRRSFRSSRACSFISEAELGEFVPGTGGKTVVAAIDAVADQPCEIGRRSAPLCSMVR